MSGEAGTKRLIGATERLATGRATVILGGLGMGDAREVMNIRQASQYLGVSPDTLYKYVSEERIPAFKLGNRWKFKKSLLDTWMEDQSLNNEVSRSRKPTRSSKTIVS
jgi:excisionase family DNA binding protein